MSLEDIAANKKYIKSMRLNASMDNLSKGKFVFDKYKDLTDLEVAQKIKDRAAANKFFDVEHISGVKGEARNIYYPNNMQMATGNIGSFMDNFKRIPIEQPNNPTIGQIDNFLSEYNLTVRDAKNNIRLGNKAVIEVTDGVSNIVVDNFNAVNTPFEKQTIVKVSPTKKGVTAKSIRSAGQLIPILKKMGYRCPKSSGGSEDLQCYLNDVRKTKEDIRSSNPEVRSKAIIKQRNALKQAQKIPQVMKSLKRGAQGALGFIGGFPGIVLEGLIEFGAYDYYRQKGYSHKQAAAEGTFFAKKLGLGDLKPGEGRGLLEGADVLLRKELIGGDPAKQKYFDIKDAMDQKASELETLNRELKTLKSGARGYGGGDDFEIFDKEEEIKRAVEEYIKLENTIKPGTPLYQSYQTGLEKQEAIQEARREEGRKSSYLTGLPETEMTKENRERNLALRREREMKQFPPMSMDDFADNIFTDDHLEGIQNAYKDPTITKKDMLDVFRQKEEFNKGLFQGIFEQADKSSAGQERLLGTQGEFSSGGIASGPPPEKGPQSQGLAYLMKNGKR
jgi:hypothetical protein